MCTQNVDPLSTVLKIFLLHTTVCCVSSVTGSENLKIFTMNQILSLSTLFVALKKSFKDVFLYT